MKKRTNIKDIAIASGVSITTVSLIFNNKANSIPQETIDRVKQIAKEKGYQPNAIASSLKTKKTKMIGYVMPSIENNFFAEIAQRVEKIVGTYGYNIIICSSNDKFEKDYSSISTLSSRMIDFLIYCPSTETLTNGNLKRINELLSTINIPYVVVDRQLDGDIKNKVVCDDHQGGVIATQYLIDNGHRCIGCITGPLETSSAQNRFAGYVDCLMNNHIAYDRKLVQYGNFDVNSGYEAAKELLKEENITAIFACNDLMAYGAIKAIKEAKKSIPKDISLIGYDDLIYSQLLDVPLTTIHQDMDGIATAIGDLIINILEKWSNELTIKVVPSYLVERTSVCRKEA